MSFRERIATIGFHPLVDPRRDVQRDLATA
jgi:hypothetical protein